ncbi:Anaerobic glycerol-3-phosphate dehydrogenase subunit C [Novipirellula galeiformis]|uniref:Anaerobic glycerol-3-phosphate dehydrogenase subunit C n=1 Tax=Novipirellula galeiformis TaxID=2528004 RepID=A0A5C6CL50_9BACT|nr:anaerobic glycerol-3-phosphate dehydrogenase subunit C [Novipirellula galeiformis]TWU24287.1 Anaerobic glycerol-3-phosphate dehydrogenase subunit C [Novipirellula galeiformis]
MDSERQRIQDDLRGVVRGEVLCDDISCQLYATDASIYQMLPLGVVRPRTAADVIATVQYGAEHDLSIHPRGSASGVSGESLGSGLVLDFSRFMRRVTIDRNGATVNVQCGAVLAEVNAALAPYGRTYGPDPATRSITTMGSVLSTNASGSHYLRSGSARDTIESMRVVTVDGKLLTFSKHHPDEQTPQGRLARGIVEIESQFRTLIAARKSAPNSRGGYRFDGVIDSEGRVDLAKFMVGTQGTLGIIVDAVLRTEAIPTHRGVALLFYRRLDSAVRCARRALEHGLVACDLMDRRLLQIARETDPRFADLLPREAEAMLLVEIQGESLGDLYDRLAIIRQECAKGPDAAFAAVDTVRDSERDLYWTLSRRVVPRLYRFKGSDAPQPFTEDIAVPADRLPAALLDIQDTLKRNHATATVFAHAGHGHLHVRPFLNLAKQVDRDKLNDLSNQIAEVVWKHGGEVSVEHAAGFSRSHLLPRQYGQLWQAMGQIKRLFDSCHRLNPGKLFGAVLQKPNENLRPFDKTIEVSRGNRTLIEAEQSLANESDPARKPLAQLEVFQNWPPGASVDQVTRQCNGCGRCRTNSAVERQCPMFRATHSEEASPRAKANLLRGVLSGQLKVENLADDRAKEVADLCFNCHQCRVECPAGVDIPKIVGELKAQYVTTNGLPLSDLLLGRIDTIAAIASRFPWLANPLIRGRFSRWLAERLFGLSAARDLPLIASETFMRYAAKRRWTKLNPHGGLKVAYFVDHYANYHDPEIGRGLAEILQHNGIGLYVPPGQVASGMARISAGDIKGARRVARHNLRVLAEAVRQGYTIIATEPAAVLCLKHEYPNLMDDQDAHLVAENSFEACQFLWNLHQENRLSLDLDSMEADLAYHQPCHLRVLDPDGAGPKLMSLIPRFDVEQIEAGCTGMAGTWGLQRKNYRNSLRVGWPLISAMRSAGGKTAVTECSACKMQIEHGAGRKTLHPIKLFAYAYGRMPKLAKELR